MVEKGSDHSSDKSPSTPEQGVQRSCSSQLGRSGAKNSKVRSEQMTFDQHVHVSPVLNSLMRYAGFIVCLYSLSNFPAFSPVTLLKILTESHLRKSDFSTTPSSFQWPESMSC